MKILMLGPGKPTIANSGLGIATDRILSGLKNRTQIEVLSPEKVQSMLDEKINQDHPVAALALDEPHVIKELASPRLSHTLSPYFYLNPYLASDISDEPSDHSPVYEALDVYSFEVQRLAADFDFDIIYAHDWINIPAGLKLKALSGKPLVLHIHSLDYDRSNSQSHSWVFNLEKEGLQLANKVIAVSNYHKEIIVQKYGVDRGNIEVIHLATDVPANVVRKKKFPEQVIVFAGRLAGQKGPDQFLKIARLVHEKNKNTRFVMVGTGELMEHLIESGAYMHLDGKLHFTGHISQQMLFDVYAMADIYCMPSVSEPFGLSAIEAAAHGLPVVISKQSGAAELLPDAALADYWDTEAFANHILTLLGQEPDNPAIEKTRTSLRQHSWDKAVDHIFELLQDLSNQ